MAKTLTISQLEKQASAKLHYTGVVDLSFADFRKRVLAHEDEIFSDLFGGKVFILRNTHSKEQLVKQKNIIHEFGLNTPAVFHKIHGDCPNFHVINEGNPLYNVLMRIHSYHFFSWNDNPINMFPDVREALEVYETLCEYEPTEILSNTCDNDVVARLQIHHYPTGGGHTQIHTDPTDLVKVAWITMMTKRGVDYESGGLYLLDISGNKFYPETSSDLNIGDTVTFYPKLAHGVDAIDAGETSEWESDKGRWAMIFNNLPVSPTP
jgi:hypothetical protein